MAMQSHFNQGVEKRDLRERRRWWGGLVATRKWRHKRRRCGEKK